MAARLGKSIEEYRAKARQRGRELMQAICEVWLAEEILVMHGPYVSEPKTPNYVSMLQVGACVIG